MKKMGFGVGRWNGFGGKVESGETIEQAASREYREEAGIDPLNLELVGFNRFLFEGATTIHDVHIFLVRNWNGEPVEIEEMRPQWFPVDALPFDSMWPDDRFWVQRVLAGERARGEFLYRRHDTIISHTLDFQVAITELLV